MGPYELLGNTVLILERLRIPYIVTGSIASMAYGEPRLTNDIDIVADVEEKHISGLLEAFPPNEFYISEDMIRDAIRRKSQFNIIHPASGLKVGIIIKVDSPFRDITGILKVSEDNVDYGYISEWAERLGLTEIWKAINDRISREM